MLLKMLTGRPFGATLTLRRRLKKMTSSDYKGRVSVDEAMESLRQICMHMQEVRTH
jgi:hypothetical protein